MILQGIVENSLCLLYSINVAIDFILTCDHGQALLRTSKNQFGVELGSKYGREFSSPSGHSCLVNIRYIAETGSLEDSLWNLES